ncbi:hypothetical protein [Paracoccus sp. (in: a-proteobacteria)]|nr:hypothetical protein [Paracoccus sp. (in: a-proteobacteria)]
MRKFDIILGSHALGQRYILSRAHYIAHRIHLVEIVVVKSH